MPNRDDISWFKREFSTTISATVRGTPFNVDILAALACQETGEIWARLRRRGLNTTRILELCTGDTLDSDNGRAAFPRNKSELIRSERGEEMFQIARSALVEMAKYIPSYASVAKRPEKFCHGFGLFQRDLQFFQIDPEYFLKRRYVKFENTLKNCILELNKGLVKLNLTGRRELTDLEAAAVAITYNTGRYVASKGLRQGYFDGEEFYGQRFYDYLALSKTVTEATDGENAVSLAPGHAVLPPPANGMSAGEYYKIDTKESTLRVRSEPLVSNPTNRNVVAQLPDGHLVRALTSRAVRGFREIEARLGGARVTGFCATKFLVPHVSHVGTIESGHAAPLYTPVVKEALMPLRRGQVITRRQLANAHSLNEPGQPKRVADNAADLRRELGAIIEWLDVENPDFLRYQPRAGLTFCNIYAHDYCHLAGVYLPRVWWTQRALLEIQAGMEVAPLIASTIEEVRANGLFRWLRDFGAAFEWRQIETLSKLQNAANAGAVCLIVARRKEDGRSGHLALVVPETSKVGARRDANGDVTGPVQSQAGVKNIRASAVRGTWWSGAQFAESAFWAHS